MFYHASELLFSDLINLKSSQALYFKIVLKPITRWKYQLLCKFQRERYRSFVQDVNLTHQRKLHMYQHIMRTSYPRKAKAIR